MKTLMGIVTAALLMNMMVSLAHAESAPKSIPTCTLASEGVVTNAWVKHRILIGEDAVYGANDMESIVEHLHQLRSQGACR